MRFTSNKSKRIGLCWRRAPKERRCMRPSQGLGHFPIWEKTLHKTTFWLLRSILREAGLVRHFVG